jgi:hypothetical protein
MIGNDALKFLKSLDKLDEIWNHHGDSEYNERQLVQFAETYHEYKLEMMKQAKASPPLYPKITRMSDQHAIAELCIKNAITLPDYMKRSICVRIMKATFLEERINTINSLICMQPLRVEMKEE